MTGAANTEEALGSAERRLLVVGDLKRLGPIVADHFAPNRIEGLHTYLEAIAEIPRSPTRAVLVGYDSACRQPEAAISAIRSVAPDVPVVLCCDPAHETATRRLLEHGADDYVIFPPESAELERALGIPSRKTQACWVETTAAPPIPTAEELACLADVLPQLQVSIGAALEGMAKLTCIALSAQSATVLYDGRSGRAGRPGQPRFDGVLVEPILRGEHRVGQIRVGGSCGGGFSQEHLAKLRHYGVLFGRMLESTLRAEHWRTLSMTDDLTGLANRRRLMEFLDKTLEAASATRSTVTALVFDIDDFKRYNDSYGHDAGDEILRDVGKLFVACSRKSDMVARHGGDEFVVVFWNPDGPRTVGSQHPEDVKTVIKRFRGELGKHSFSRLGSEAVGCLTISGGLAQFPWQARTSEELIRAADQALLQAKLAGKNRFFLIGEGNL